MSEMTPERYRTLAKTLDGCTAADRNAVRVALLRESAAALRAAADEVDRLRQQALDGALHNIRQNVDLTRLRVVIENAPHDRECNWNDAMFTPGSCNCWKVDAL